MAMKIFEYGWDTAMELNDELSDYNEAIIENPQEHDAMLESMMDADMECAVCDGEGGDCDRCNGTGRVNIFEED